MTCTEGKDREKLEGYAKEYILNSGVERSIINKYQPLDYDKINPKRIYNEESARMEIMEKKALFEQEHKTKDYQHIEQEHEIKGRQYENKAQLAKAGINQEQFNKIAMETEDKRNKVFTDIKDKQNARENHRSKMRDEVKKDIEAGAEKSKSGVFGWASIKPELSKTYEDKDKKK